MSSSQKTDYPTRKRLEDERKKGNVPISKEFATFIMMVGYTIIFLWLLPDASEKIFLRLKSFYYLHDQYLNDGFIIECKSLIIETFGSLFFSALFLIFLAITASVFQTGFILSIKNISPSLDKISINNGIKRLFSSKSIVETIFSALKLLIVVIVVLFVLLNNLLTSIVNVHSVEHALWIGIFYENLLNVLIKLTIFTGIIGILDLLYRNFSYINSLKMSKQELKDELKDTEGRPEVKSKMREMRRSIIKYNVRKIVKEADVVITNPTHYAVVLKYDEETMHSPKLLTKGQGLKAIIIKEIALENKIAVIENQALAQSIYKTVKIDDFIKEEHYAAVAEIINYIYRSRNQTN